MANTFFGLTIGQSGLTASNIGINTVAHNVSNINTEGYTRQSTEQVASFGIRTYSSYGSVGTGVTVEKIAQARSEYYDNRYWVNNASCGQYEAMDKHSALLQDYLDEFNLEGFITEYNNFFKAIDELASNPNGEVERTQFINYCKSICDYFNTLSTNLRNMQADIDSEIRTDVDNINTIATRLASLNKQINTIEAAGGNANDLRDQRYLLIDKLSSFVDTSVVETAMGNGVTNFKVFINNQVLVDNYDYNTLVCKSRETEKKRNASDAEGLCDIEWNYGMPFNTYEVSLKGSLRGLVDMRDGCNNAYEEVVYDENDVASLAVRADEYRNSSHKGVAYYQSQLNNFLTAFAKEFNDIILQGQLNDGSQNTEPLFISRFDKDGYVTASNITINPIFYEDLSKLPHSFDVSRGVENNDMALALRGLKDKVTIKSGTFWDYLSSIVSEVSVDTMRAKNFTTNYKSIRTTIDNQRMSISGVDEDEEGVDLVKYQTAYNLSSKVISIMNQVYSKLIEETGL